MGIQIIKADRDCSIHDLTLSCCEQYCPFNGRCEDIDGLTEACLNDLPANYHPTEFIIAN